MFRRRNKPNAFDWLRNIFWPRIGWRRAWVYWLHRMGRLPGSDYSISVGFAFGAAISFTPFVGLHFLLAALLSWICRANILASAIGTAVGNPWTFPFIWIWIYKLGVWMGYETPEANVPSMDFAGFFGNMLKSLLRFDLNYLAETAWPIFGPMLLGSLPTAIIAWLAFYLIWHWSISAYRRARLRRRAARRQRQLKRKAKNMESNNMGPNNMGEGGNGPISAPRN